ncbi:NAD(P)-dependent malic enzyme [Saccharococcus caldoxylosilyticus]|jgi:malate dehydrogenase (oxaloacetate-decarboxylating)|uniref:NADP-dependent malic enzyme n=2 Tax=Saccharococcus caldoxylosilyticus TaxID=81408 RepID=A0A150LTY9_9BACL|nr:malic enzyme-like NAD(P)-binding protein [Parageobacillus caldoxylosilyticus]OQP02555.1 NAD-dependent malic enzyme [Geobacillus sp. 44B]KYD15775.1 NADP-dependent malic enzyme [Parageobacillus caldoxylosilyticus]MBB3851582.1 malate dehydrogenase (oxaloacetate-decarboxylating) [Parageobacillus caldoxylosilyticus]QNU37407.1 NAD-dependent malic enzyme [Geobacillus sp. 44B]BDG35592.1 NAD-dependent malic enzyme [Parageobacillus caldoxylosilyticus]
MRNLREKSLLVHQQAKGKLYVDVKVPIENADDLSVVYSPGVAEPCKEIYVNPDLIYDYTMKGNFVAVVSNGSAVLGLGNIGASASMPVMEGKAALFKAFAGIDAVPLCINTDDPEQIIQTVKLLEPTFGGINLEDIAAPNCFLIEERLKQELSIPVFHDDQHGTAIVTAAGLINALKVVQKRLSECKVVINGAGAAGIAIAKLLLYMGVGDIILCDSKGAIYENRPYGMNKIKETLAKQTNRGRVQGTLKEVIQAADIFIGVSVAGALTPEMVRSMNDNAIVFALANPVPEIMPDEAKAAGAAIVATGRSDLPNQVNNVLAFPGIFKGALRVRASEINEEMKLAAVSAIAGLISPEELTNDYVIPNPFDKRVVAAVADAVARAAIRTGVARSRDTEKEQENVM